MTKLRITISITIALIIGVIGGITTTNNKTPKSQTPNSSISNTEDKSHYYVKEHNGKIAVFLNDGTSPIYTLDSPYVRDLPKYDQNLLQKGIFAESNTKLLEILQDYDY